MAMTSDELLDQFRTDMEDTVAPYLWSDTEVYRYIDAAQKEFCRRTYGISDSLTDEVCRLAITTDTEYVSLDPRILKIRGARHEATGDPVDIINYEDIYGGAISVSRDYGNMVTRYRLNSTPGPVVKALVTNMEQDKVRIVPISSDEQVIMLSVYRLPLLDIETDSQVLEIHEQHHLYLLYWVKHLALLKQDAETFDKNKSAEMSAAFLAYCDQAKGEQSRREHKPREVVYGGI